MIGEPQKVNVYGEQLFFVDFCKNLGYTQRNPTEILNQSHPNPKKHNIKERSPMPRSERIPRLIHRLYANPPEIEPARALLVTEAYRATEAQPILLRRAAAFRRVLAHIPICIREEELIVGSSTLAPRGCQTYPEFSYEWLEKEFDTVAGRSADPFYISAETKAALLSVHGYWKGRTTSELALAYMAPETQAAIRHNLFTVGNYFYNGVGHISVDYAKVLRIGFDGIAGEARAALGQCRPGDGYYPRRSRFLQGVIGCCQAAVAYARRYAALARQTAAACADPVRKGELLRIAENCEKVPAQGAETFYEALQSFWFVQQLIQLESSGHSISPGRFDQYLYPYYKQDLAANRITPGFAQELLDCVWVKLNDLNKCRDAVSAEGFAGYSLFQNLIVGGQDAEGRDATNDLSYMCIRASAHVFLPQPSLSIRVWNGTPHPLLLEAARLTRQGIGLPAYFNDEVIIPALMNRGLPLADARDYCVIGCVEPQKAGKTDGWHDAAFFNMCRPLELVFTNGWEGGEQVGPQTGTLAELTTYGKFFAAYRRQMDYHIALLANADNAVDAAHQERCPLPFLSSMVADCVARGKSVQEGGAVYNFTGPQGFGVANVGDALYAVKTLVYDRKALTLEEYRQAMALNYGKGLPEQDAAQAVLAVAEALRQAGKPPGPAEIAEITATVLRAASAPEAQGRLAEIYEQIEALPKFGNDIPEVDAFAREAAYTYTRPLETYTNPRGGTFQAGLYPVSANVPLGAQTGATPDGRLARTPVADGVSPSAGKDTHGPTAAANSVARLDHAIASNGTLFNQKFHPTALEGDGGLNNFIALIRSFFDQKGMHMQFNVVDRQTLLDAQQNPQNYRSLVVRVAGYSALFTTLSKSLQDDIIRRTEQGLPR
jgi:formate C-acetyltransferase